MSKLRPGLCASVGGQVPDRFDFFYMVREAVRSCAGLIHGRLHDSEGRSCAIGRFWDVHPTLALYDAMVDEVAAVNDSWPGLALRTRRRRVLTWLDEKLEYLKGRGARR